MPLLNSIGRFIDTLGLRPRTSNADFMDFPESTIRYRIVGSGSNTIAIGTDPPIVIEHYEKLISYLKNDFRVIVFELPGFGFSFPGKKADFGFKPMNDLMARFLDKLGYGPYILAFPCVGSYGAIDITNRFPSLVKGVVVIQAPSWEEEIKWKHGRDPMKILSKPVIGQIALRMLKRKRASEWVKAAIGKKELIPEFVGTVDNAFASGSCFCLASAFQNYLTENAPDLPAITQPALILWGDADKSHKKTDKSTSSVYCPGAERMVFENAGHFPELEEPELFAERLKNWVAEI